MSSPFQDARISEFWEFFERMSHLFNQDLIPEIESKGTSRVIATLPLNNHIIYGETVLYINELLDSSGNIEEYRYAWEFSQRKKKLSKHTKHITSFDKQKHPKPPRNVKTDPYHHHHVPGETSPRTETNVKSLHDVINILTDYIVGQLEYDENHRF